MIWQQFQRPIKTKPWFVLTMSKWQWGMVKGNDDITLKHGDAQQKWAIMKTWLRNCKRSCPTQALEDTKAVCQEAELLFFQQLLEMFFH